MYVRNRSCISCGVRIVASRTQRQDWDSLDEQALIPISDAALGPPLGGARQLLRGMSLV